MAQLETHFDVLENAINAIFYRAQVFISSLPPHTREERKKLNMLGSNPATSLRKASPLSISPWPPGSTEDQH